jgi:hypothetical protein
MAGIKIGIDRELEADFREFAHALGLADVRSEPSSAAGGLEVVLFDLHGLHVSSQFVWGALLAWAVSRSKFFEVFYKGTRMQPAKEDFRTLEKLVRAATKFRPTSRSKKKVVTRKSPAKRKK